MKLSKEEKIDHFVHRGKNWLRGGAKKVLKLFWIFKYKDKCALGLGIDEENQLKISSYIFQNYCVLFDTFLNQIAFAPKVVKSEDMDRETEDFC